MSRTHRHPVPGRKLERPFERLSGFGELPLVSVGKAVIEVDAPMLLTDDLCRLPCLLYGPAVRS